MWSGSSFREVFQYMLKTWHKHHKFWVWTKLNRNTVSALTMTLSTHSIFKCSGIVVIHSPFVRRRNIPCSAANHMSYSPKFCQRSMSRSGCSKTGKEIKAKIYKITSSKTFLSLPLSTTIVVFGSLQSTFKGSFRPGCTLRSISLIWSPLLPGVSTGSVNVALNP